MLILDRKKGQELVVPQYGIVFKIVEIRGNQVRVGIAAPADVAAEASTRAIAITAADPIDPGCGLIDGSIAVYKHI